jgi:hypothetical protein
MLARRGHQRCHCNEEGFGTLSRRLGNDGGYRSSCARVSGPFAARQPSHKPGNVQGRGKAHRAGFNTGAPHRVLTVVTATVRPLRALEGRRVRASIGPARRPASTGRRPWRFASTATRSSILRGRPSSLTTPPRSRLVHTPRSMASSFRGLGTSAVTFWVRSTVARPTLHQLPCDMSGIVAP